MGEEASGGGCVRGRMPTGDDTHEEGCLRGACPQGGRPMGEDSHGEGCL